MTAPHAAQPGSGAASSRAALLQLLAAGLVAGSVLVAASWIADRPAPQVQVPVPEIVVEAPPIAPHSLVVADGELYYADGRGHFFHLEPTSSGLRVARVLRLVRDPLRHQGAPQQRALHGYYLDDLATEAEAQRAVLRTALHAAGGDSLAASLARELLAIGDIEGLIAELSGSPVSVRRQVALMLGEAGFLAAIPVLVELLSESGETRYRAYGALKNITGEDLAENIERVDQSRTARAYDAWLSAHPPATPYARVPPPPRVD